MKNRVIFVFFHCLKTGCSAGWPSSCLVFFGNQNPEICWVTWWRLLWQLNGNGCRQDSQIIPIGFDLKTLLIVDYQRFITSELNIFNLVLINV